MHHWTLTVNGERLFLKGANAGPTRMALAEATPEDLRRDVAFAADAGLDLLRIHGHITRPEVYGRPTSWACSSGGPPAAVGVRPLRRQAGGPPGRGGGRPAGHHPSVAIWCGHNELLTIDVAPGEPVTSSGAHGVRHRPGAAELEPLDPRRPHQAHARAGRRSRPVIAHSG